MRHSHSPAFLELETKLNFLSALLALLMCCDDGTLYGNLLYSLLEYLTRHFWREKVKV